MSDPLAHWKPFEVDRTWHDDRKQWLLEWRIAGWHAMTWATAAEIVDPNWRKQQAQELDWQYAGWLRKTATIEETRA